LDEFASKLRSFRCQPDQCVSIPPRNRFRAVRTQGRVDDQVVYLPGPAKELLGVSGGARLSLIPFE